MELGGRNPVHCSVCPPRCLAPWVLSVQSLRMVGCLKKHLPHCFVSLNICKRLLIPVPDLKLFLSIVADEGFNFFFLHLGRAIVAE